MAEKTHSTGPIQYADIEYGARIITDKDGNPIMAGDLEAGWAYEFDPRSGIMKTKADWHNTPGGDYDRSDCTVTESDGDEMYRLAWRVAGVLLGATLVAAAVGWYVLLKIISMLSAAS